MLFPRIAVYFYFANLNMRYLLIFRNVVQPHQTNAASNVLLEARQFAANAASGSAPLVRHS